jgi:hypothetical protein
MLAEWLIALWSVDFFQAHSDLLLSSKHDEDMA